MSFETVEPAPTGIGTDPTATDQPAITIDNVSKHYLMFERPDDRLKQMIVPRLQRAMGLTPKRYYRDFSAVRNVSFSVGHGETVGIIGRNGSGKSTLLQMVCGTLTPTTGSVTINGRIAALLELGAGFNPEFTGRENVFLNATILGLQYQEIEARFDAIAGFADIGMFIDQPVKTYSSGMYVRLAFAVAINVDPDILVVDEALAVGDEAFQRKCFARIEDIKDRGGTILFVSHGAQTIVQLCDRAILLDGGEAILDGRPKTVVNQYQRLVNLSGEQAAAVRAEIVEMSGLPARAVASEGEDVAGSDDDGGGGDISNSAGNAAAVLQPALVRDESWFDPNLKSESRVEYESKGAVIQDIQITASGGRKVNRLQHLNSYRLEIRAQFDRNVKMAGFGMAIRTVTGLELGGQGSHNLGTGIPVQAGDTVCVGFPFVAAMLPGTYFASAGVSSHGQTSFEQLHRVLDGIVFRVEETENGRPISCLVNFALSDSNVTYEVNPAGERRR